MTCTTLRKALYHLALIGTHRDRLRATSGRREGAGDVGHRQAFSTPSEGARRRPERRLAEAFGWRRARLTIPRIAAPHAPTRSRQRRACRATPARRLRGSLSAQDGISRLLPIYPPVRLGFEPAPGSASRKFALVSRDVLPPCRAGDRLPGFHGHPAWIVANPERRIHAGLVSCGFR